MKLRFNALKLVTEVEVNSGGHSPSCKAVVHTTFTDTEVNINCFSTYHKETKKWLEIKFLLKDFVS